MDENIKKILEADALVTYARESVDTAKEALRDARERLDEAVIRLHQVIQDANNPQMNIPLDDIDIEVTTNSDPVPEL